MGDDELAVVSQSLEVSTYPRNNPWAKDHPADIDEVDLTEKENGLRVLLTSDQNWLHQGNPTGDMVLNATDLSVRKPKSLIGGMRSSSPCARFVRCIPKLG